MGKKLEFKSTQWPIIEFFQKNGDKISMWMNICGIYCIMILSLPWSFPACRSVFDVLRSVSIPSKTLIAAGLLFNAVAIFLIFEFMDILSSQSSLKIGILVGFAVLSFLIWFDGLCCYWVKQENAKNVNYAVLKDLHNLVKDGGDAISNIAENLKPEMLSKVE